MLLHIDLYLYMLVRCIDISECNGSLYSSAIVLMSSVKIVK